MADKWTRVTKTEAIAFSFPCTGNYYYSRMLRTNIGCTKLDGKHGHIELMTFEDGYTFIPFYCYSQAMVKMVVETLKLEESGFKGIPDLPEVKQLPEELTEQERVILASPSEMEKLARAWGFWSA